MYVHDVVKVEGGWVKGGGDSVWDRGEFYPEDKYVLYKVCDSTKKREHIATIGHEEGARLSSKVLPANRTCPECGGTMEGFIEYVPGSTSTRNYSIIWRGKCAYAGTTIREKF